MKVLIIDDIPDSVKAIEDHCHENSWECYRTDFDDAYQQLGTFSPDVVILDWKGDPDGTENGRPILDFIWSVAFRPVIIFSGYAQFLLEDEVIKGCIESSSFVQLIGKGDEQDVINALENLASYATALTDFRSDVGSVLIESYNIIEYLKAEQEVTKESIEYVLARRLGAYFEEKYTASISPSWVQYIYPPVNESLVVCDVLKKSERVAEVGSPEDYALILSPSCDLYTGNGREAKIKKVLCAHCMSKEAFHEHELKAEPSKSKIKNVGGKLTQGYRESFVPLPKLGNVIPYMTVDLKDIELIDIKEIAVTENKINENEKYYRVASIASPFREQIVWAHMLNSCRPGVPERNMELWAKDILTV